LRSLKFHILAIKIISTDFSRDKGYLTLELNRAREWFPKNGGDTKSETSHFSGTNYSASIIKVSTDFAKNTFLLRLIESNLIVS